MPQSDRDVAAFSDKRETTTAFEPWSAAITIAATASIRSIGHGTPGHCADASAACTIRPGVRRILFTVRGVEVGSYVTFLFLGLTFGVAAGRAAGIARGLDPGRLHAALLIHIVPALIGSRLLYVTTHWRVYRAQPSLVWSTRDGGAALYGGLLLALVCTWPVLQVLGLPLGAFWDAATVTMLVGMIFAKVGCLLNGCCAGRETAGWLALTLPDTHGIWRRRVPAQLMEAALAAVLLAGALAWSARPFDGALFLAALAAYGLARLGLESARESTDRLGGVNVYRVISIALVVGAIAAFVAITCGWH